MTTETKPPRDVWNPLRRYPDMLQRKQEPCALCGGPHDFDTSVPSDLWNRIIRAQGLPDYLCTTCIVREFVKAREGFTAKLWSEEFNGNEIEVLVDPSTAATITKGKTVTPPLAQWQPISTAPKDETWVLLGGCSFGHEYHVARWSEWMLVGFDWGDYSTRGYEPTHWMPLPPAPGEPLPPSSEYQRGKSAEAYPPQMDWQQVILNDGPPCFALLDDEERWYCGRAERWDGHDGEHKYVSLGQALSEAREQGLLEAAEIVQGISETVYDYRGSMPKHVTTFKYNAVEAIRSRMS